MSAHFFASAEDRATKKRSS